MMRTRYFALFALLSGVALTHPAVAGAEANVDRVAQMGDVIGAATACHLETASQRLQAEHWIAVTFAGPGQTNVALDLLRSEQDFAEHRQAAQPAETCSSVGAALAALMG